MYVSSTKLDLEVERRATIDWLVAAGHQPVHSYVADSDTVRKSCLDDVDLCDLYVLILSRGFWIGARAQTSFGRIVAGSLTLTFFVYIFVNMGMVTGLLPVVGVPLPLVSAGGTSVVTLMLGFGILMAISTEHRRVVH